MKKLQSHFKLCFRPNTVKVPSDNSSSSDVKAQSKDTSSILQFIFNCKL